MFPVVGLGVLSVGVIYWYLCAKVLPKLGNYKIYVERETLEDGNEVVRYKKIRYTESLLAVERKDSGISQA